MGGYSWTARLKGVRTMFNGFTRDVPITLSADTIHPTNADRIRGMSDEELANELIYEACFNEGDYDYDEEPIDSWEPYHVCSDGERYMELESAVEHELDWLRQPAETEENL